MLESLYMGYKQQKTPININNIGSEFKDIEKTYVTKKKFGTNR